MSESKHLSQVNCHTRNAHAKTSSTGIIRKYRNLRILTKESIQDTLTIEINSSTRSGKRIMNRKMTTTRSTQKKMISRISSYIINTTRKDLCGSKITKLRLHELKISLTRQCQPFKRPIRLQVHKESLRLFRNILTNRFNLSTSPKKLKVSLNLF